MGVVDSKVINLNCPSCGISETIKVLQHGSAYSASWQGNPKFMKFDVNWLVSDQLRGPRISSAVCKTCGIVGKSDET